MTWHGSELTTQRESFAKTLSGRRVFGAAARARATRRLQMKEENTSRSASKNLGLNASLLSAAMPPMVTRKWTYGCQTRLYPRFAPFVFFGFCVAPRPIFLGHLQNSLPCINS